MEVSIWMAVCLVILPSSFLAFEIQQILAIETNISYPIGFAFSTSGHQLAILNASHLFQYSLTNKSFSLISTAKQEQFLGLTWGQTSLAVYSTVSLHLFERQFEKTVVQYPYFSLDISSISAAQKDQSWYVAFSFSQSKRIMEFKVFQDSHNFQLQYTYVVPFNVKKSAFSDDHKYLYTTYQPSSMIIIFETSSRKSKVFQNLSQPTKELSFLRNTSSAILSTGQGQFALYNIQSLDNISAQYFSKTLYNRSCLCSEAFFILANSSAIQANYLKGNSRSDAYKQIRDFQEIFGLECFQENVNRRTIGIIDSQGQLIIYKAFEPDTPPPPPCDLKCILGLSLGLGLGLPVIALIAYIIIQCCQCKVMMGEEVESNYKEIKRGSGSSIISDEESRRKSIKR